mmetsp:Transcript_11459/g.25539  ORF Transcript_11459/g.25539 Transcript_11459/m.25539 type:complete len:267 (+) Transcript_11459:48-848(+)|eukprot:CAMPEP_0168756180 /NCGR_PEP_ID=MMETSP0724-20121128/20464_1 /TAXON_ID=265536 /ORGANISM="Amphiprora sp., Strain CCMP467" /LENGTH=266 /DNA_ID=CAMNT_0008804843 /DNA_START=71 /DNA_END=871 /DNA_ORIENTATION=-
MIRASFQHFSRIWSSPAKSCRRRLLTSSALSRSSSDRSNNFEFCSTPSNLGALVVLTGGISILAHEQQQTTLLDAKRVPIGGELINAGTPVKEPSTGILFPQLCNGLYLAGCGVRAKWGLIKVYAVGTYLDPLAMSAVKTSKDKAVLQKALLDPTYPRTIRIVMARGLSVDKFTSAIVEAVEPRMNGKDLEKLEEFRKLMPPVDLIKGAEMEMTIRGDTLLFKNPTGGVGTIRSRAFTEAMCDVYYGDDAVSPSHKESVLEGIPKL